MHKFSFLNDYSEGAHPRILQALTETNLVQDLGYGDDQYCRQAAAFIRTAAASPAADVHFVSGGTQANLTLLSSFLKSYESVIAVESGHICVHEAGAIEATGHKVHILPGQHGKLSAAGVEAVVLAHSDEHMVKPRVVYISQSTELGTIYTAHELHEIAAVCKKHDLYFYMDGARLGSALTSPAADISLPEISQLLDAYYIGGTKNGALLGEALVINHPLLKPYLRYQIKQRGGLLSKGRLLGIQFLELFRDNLFFELAAHANQMAQKLAEGIAALGYGFQAPSPTNQIFPIFPNPVIERMNALYLFYTWEKVDAGHSVVRLVTSWATPETAVDGFLEDLRGLEL